MTNSASLIYVHIALWLCVCAIVFVAILLKKYMQKLFNKIAPLGALTSGTVLSDALPQRSVTMLDGSELDLKETCLLFVDASCPVSRKMIPIARSFARKEQRSLLFCTDAPEHALHESLETLGVDASELTNSPELGYALGVDRLPFGALIAENYTVAARGLVNSREHLESLSVSVKTGYASIQDYLEEHPLLTHSS